MLTEEDLGRYGRVWSDRDGRVLSLLLSGGEGLLVQSRKGRGLIVGVIWSASTPRGGGFP